MKKFLPLFVSLLLAGCTTTTFKSSAGDSFSRTSVLNKSAINGLEISIGTAKAKMSTYSNDQTEIAAIVAGAVADGLAKATAAAVVVPK